MPADGCEALATLIAASCAQMEKQRGPQAQQRVMERMQALPRCAACAAVCYGLLQKRPLHAQSLARSSVTHALGGSAVVV